MNIVSTAHGATATAKPIKAKAPASRWGRNIFAAVDDVVGSGPPCLGFKLDGFGVFAAVIGGAHNLIAIGAQLLQFIAHILHAGDGDGAFKFGVRQRRVVVLVCGSASAAAKN